MPFKCSDHVFICLLASFSFRVLQIFNDSRFGCTLTTSRWRLQECFFVTIVFYHPCLLSNFLFPLWDSLKTRIISFLFFPYHGSAYSFCIFLYSSCLDFAPFGPVALGAADLEDQAPPWYALAAPWRVPWRLDGERGSHRGRTSLCREMCRMLPLKKYLHRNVVCRHYGSA